MKRKAEALDWDLDCFITKKRKVIVGTIEPCWINTVAYLQPELLDLIFFSLNIYAWNALPVVSRFWNVRYNHILKQIPPIKILKRMLRNHERVFWFENIDYSKTSTPHYCNPQNRELWPSENRDLLKYTRYAIDLNEYFTFNKFENGVEHILRTYQTRLVPEEHLIEIIGMEEFSAKFVDFDIVMIKSRLSNLDQKVDDGEERNVLTFEIRVKDDAKVLINILNNMIKFKDAACDICLYTDPLCANLRRKWSIPFKSNTAVNLNSYYTHRIKVVHKKPAGIPIAGDKEITFWLRFNILWDKLDTYVEV